MCRAQLISPKSQLSSSRYMRKEKKFLQSQDSESEFQILQIEEPWGDSLYIEQLVVYPFMISISNPDKLIEFMRIQGQHEIPHIIISEQMFSCASRLCIQLVLSVEYYMMNVMQAGDNCITFKESLSISSIGQTMIRYLASFNPFKH